MARRKVAASRSCASCCPARPLSGSHRCRPNGSRLVPFGDRFSRMSGTRKRPAGADLAARRYAEIGSNVVLGWKPGREAARAAFDALPLLKQAQRVQILQVGQQASDQPGPAGVPAEILSFLAAEAADLLVMGAYGQAACGN